MQPVSALEVVVAAWPSLKESELAEGVGPDERLRPEQATSEH